MLMSSDETNYVLRDFWRKPGKMEVAAVGGSHLGQLKRQLIGLGVPESSFRPVAEPDEGWIISGAENMKIIAKNGGRFSGSSEFLEVAKGT